MPGRSPARHDPSAVAALIAVTATAERARRPHRRDGEAAWRRRRRARRAGGACCRRSTRGGGVFSRRRLGRHRRGLADVTMPAARSPSRPTARAWSSTSTAEPAGRPSRAAGFNHALALPVAPRSGRSAWSWAAGAEPLQDDPLRRHAARVGGRADRASCSSRSGSTRRSSARWRRSWRATSACSGASGLDIHDGPTQQLSVALLEVQLLEADLNDAEAEGVVLPEKLRPGLGRIYETLGGALQEMRELIGHLRPAQFEDRLLAGGPGATRCRATRRQQGAAVDYQARGRVPRRPRVADAEDHLLPDPPGGAEQRRTPRRARPRSSVRLREDAGRHHAWRSATTARASIRTGSSGRRPGMPQARYGLLRDARPGAAPRRVVRGLSAPGEGTTARLPAAVAPPERGRLA